MNCLGPCRSLFHWKGELRDAAEWLIFAQVPRDGFEAFRAAAVALHPYENPCVLALPVEGGHAPFLEWVAAEAGGGACS